jgi:hypothetical protein
MAQRKRKRIRKEHEGRPMDFRAFDGETYNGNILKVYPRGIQISYYVPAVRRECQSAVVTSELHRVTVY